jgi:hypothetical protein
MDAGSKIQGLPLSYTCRPAKGLSVGKDCTMNLISQLFTALFSTSRSAPVATARALLERATQARGLSAFEAQDLRANAQALLSVLR